LDSNELHNLNTAAEQAKTTELYALMNLFPPSVKSNAAIQQRLYHNLAKLLDKENPYRKEMEIVFTEQREQFPAKTVDDEY
jgi:hypothetical protein